MRFCGMGLKFSEPGAWRPSTKCGGLSAFALHAMSRGTDVGSHSDVLTISTSGHLYNSQLQKSPSRFFGQNSGNSADISKAFLETGIPKFESSRPSQPVAQLEIVVYRIRQVPANCGLL